MSVWLTIVAVLVVEAGVLWLIFRRDGLLDWQPPASSRPAGRQLLLDVSPVCKCRTGARCLACIDRDGLTKRKAA